MRQYLDAVRRVLEGGTRKENRTGVDTISTFGVHYNIDLQQGFPLLTTKQISWKNIVVEMLWFLSGQTDIAILKKHGCKFWDAWADLETGKVPSAYGNFWRQFPTHVASKPAEDMTVACPVGWNDQIAWIVNELKCNPMSRRMVVSAWAPGNAQTSKLPPCHCLFLVNVQKINLGTPKGPLSDGQFLTAEGIKHLARHADERLCLHLTQRSCDIALGVPYNIASYALLMHMLGRFSGIPVGTFSHLLADAHAYTCKPDGSMAEYDHVPGLLMQLERAPRQLPQLYIDSSIRSLDDVSRLLEMGTEELMALFKLDGYSPHPAINFKVAV
jgi:thymidylate synthase